MKKIKRTITIRKVEFTTIKQHDHDSNLDVCPLCHSKIHALKSASDSAIEHTVAESPIKLIEATKGEEKGAK